VPLREVEDSENHRVDRKAERQKVEKSFKSGKSPSETFCLGGELASTYEPEAGGELEVVKGRVRKRGWDVGSGCHKRYPFMRIRSNMGQRVRRVEAVREGEDSGDGEGEGALYVVLGGQETNNKAKGRRAIESLAKTGSCKREKGVDGSGCKGGG